MAPPACVCFSLSRAEGSVERQDQPSARTSVHLSATPGATLLLLQSIDRCGVRIVSCVCVWKREPPWGKTDPAPTGSFCPLFVLLFPLSPSFYLSSPSPKFWLAAKVKFASETPGRRKRGGRRRCEERGGGEGEEGRGGKKRGRGHDEEGLFLGVYTCGLCRKLIWLGKANMSSLDHG